MIYGYILYAVLLFESALGFRNCDSVAFCQKLRSYQPTEEEIFSADINSLNVDVDANISLTNPSGKTIQLKISALLDDRFRFQFIEQGNDRYKLVDVLEKEPEILSIRYTSTSNNSVTLAVNESSSTKVVITNPLTIEVIQNNVTIISIPGSRLYFENTEESQAFATVVNFPNAETLFGIHQHADKLELQNTNNGVDPYRLKNLDVFGYGVWVTTAIYGAIPVLYAYSPNSTSGIFLHNAAQQWIEINPEEYVSSYFMAEGGSLDIFTFPGPTPREVVRQYVDLTGKAHLPQLWTLGYHQSRYTYESQEDVKQVIANMDLNDFPVDAIWLDIDYTDGKKYFTWNPETFNDPVEMQQNLSSTNRKLVTIIDPHIKVDSDYPVYQGAADRNLFVKNADGSNFEGECWPGTSSYLDFLNPATIDYYADQYSYENFPQTTETLAGVWNDMNEPSVFNLDSDENTLPANTVQYGGVKHRDVHNIYGFLQSKSSHQGLLQRDNYTKRPFVLTRSTFAGSQRYAAVWTGDNQASWEYLTISVPMCLNSNILGLVFCGADVGGFNNVPTDDLMGRWYQIGIWLPFFRQHSTNNVPRREPYLLNEDVQKVVREAINLRYAHLPVWYTLFYEHTRYGDPVIRPLFYNYPNDRNTIGIDNQLLLGEDILVRAVTDSNVDNVDVYFPGNDYWYQLNNDAFFKGGSRENIQVNSSFIPVYYRSGSIIARKDTPRPSTTDQRNDSYTVYVNLGPNSTVAQGRIYVDDFVSFNYVNDEYVYANLTWNGQEVILERIDGNGSNDEFPIVIEQIVINRANNFGLFKGQYKRSVFKTTANGKLLSDIKMGATNKVKFTLF